MRHAITVLTLSSLWLVGCYPEHVGESAERPAEGFAAEDSQPPELDFLSEIAAP